jgi:hypothetical protein
VLGLALLLALLAPGEARAYLDPATGSMVLQGLVAGVMGFLFFMRNQWGRVKSFFKRGSSDVEGAEKSARPGGGAD